VKIRSIIFALCGCLLCTPVYAKTFVGVLWPMFGPLPAIGLVELVAELKMMPDVEVTTYLHQEWPTLVDDMERLPKGTRTIIIGYSLGANATAFVANKTKYIDLIIALQPSMLSWNPAITGKVGRMIEVYNPNPWLTFGGMGSKKLIGPNIEYIENTDSHPGAQFSWEFRTLVKTEVAKMSTATDVDVAQADAPAAAKPAKPESVKPESVTAELTKRRPKDVATIPDVLAYADAGHVDMPKDTPKPSKSSNKSSKLAKPEAVLRQPASPPPAAPQPAPQLLALQQQASQQLASQQSALPEPPKSQPTQKSQPTDLAFLDSLSKTVDSGSLTVERPPLTTANMMDYVKRNYAPSYAAATSGN
jgi:hypothetical protein